MSDIHVMDEVEIAHWHPKVTPSPNFIRFYDRAKAVIALHECNMLSSMLALCLVL